MPPVIDTEKCIPSGICVNLCPEDCDAGLRRDNGKFVTYKKPCNHIYEQETP